jgi:ribonuclease HI
MDCYEVYTDGGCSPNPGTGGYASIAFLHGEMYFQQVGAELKTTNNRMEFKAAIEALKKIPPDSKVILYSDSQLLCKIASKEYKAKKNKDLCEELFKTLDELEVEFKWVRGHSGNKWNEACDKLVGRAIKWAEKQDEIKLRNGFQHHLYYSPLFMLKS